jgi:hypothetical protein
MKAFGFLSIIETLLQSHVAESKLAYEFSGLACGSKETPSWSNSTSIRPEPALRSYLHPAYLSLQHRALRREAPHRCAASVRYLLLAVICRAAPVLIELLMAPSASWIFSRCLAALLRLVAAPNPSPALLSRRMSAPEGLLSVLSHTAMCVTGAGSRATAGRKP